MEYDLIIVGAGISGLRVGIEYLKLNPHIKLIIFNVI
jgi:L-2-hydroxyglutarate oxidase LhgO